MSEHKPTIITKEDGNLIIVKMGGVINAATLPQSRRLVDEMIENHGIMKRHNLRILIDYKDVVDVDSATIANILERISEQKELHHVIAFVNVPEEFVHLIDIHHLEDKIKIYASEEEALEELKRPSQ